MSGTRIPKSLLEAMHLSSEALAESTKLWAPVEGAPCQRPLELSQGEYERINKSDRLIIYKQALIICSAMRKRGIFNSGLCWVITIALPELIDVSCPWSISIDDFPEVARQKPPDHHCRWMKGYWFSLDDYGLNQRIHVLRNAIKELEG